ncbi:cell pole-organizing protein PopZ [Pararhizobium capsulatum DSM 1112]|uniref:Cell pole-organizing protein PopZ n=1 Tax=Pararhizobium capsulatum DSM 1112 TaxID=1121113 RepID=A0ABU0BR20_9HYPH|nr:PopZ family protein [Pararhizobium capsulatum]MDQ0320184.1 cell pole-organizing protein PopZ [Pararhizobium capsulatum DSM 1112]
MAQPNVAREPSMDEILASIRKIIESNEPGLPGFPANDIGSASSFRPMHLDEDDTHIDDIHLTIDDDALAAEFDAEERRLNSEPATVTRADTPARPSSTEPVSTYEVAPPQSLADVAARVRAASERNTLALRSTEAEGDHRLAASSPLTTARPPLSAPFENNVATPVKAEREPEQLQVAAPVVSAPAVEPETTAIVSPEVGAQVARSFDDLTLALDAGPRRSFDEIAQDMLRPMLQEWLDDNLPTLVERLVREEIERVARGPRRG